MIVKYPIFRPLACVVVTLAGAIATSPSEANDGLTTANVPRSGVTNRTVTSEEQGTFGHEQPPKHPQLLLADAIRAVEGHAAIAAETRQTVDLFGQRLVGVGEYLEQPGEGVRLLRQVLRLQVGDDASTLLQVCDGRYHWTYRTLGKDESLVRIDAARVLKALAERGDDYPDQAAATALGPSVGGLPRLLRQLHGACDFTTIQAGRLGDEPVWRITGGWNRDYLARLLPKQKKALDAGKPADLSKLPEHVPDRIVLMLGRADLFPYNIQYWRSGKETTPERLLVGLSLRNVTLGVPVAADRFAYSPGILKPVDRTAKTLKSLGVVE